MSDILPLLDQAVQDGKLRESSRKQILRMLEHSVQEPRVQASIRELVEGGHWAELNDRFYKTMTFGTGGIRGRTIGKVVTQAEQGAGGQHGSPEFPAVGTNAMNEFNVSRATQGLVAYIRKQFPSETPRVVVSHDTRFFSRTFSVLVADVVKTMGGEAYLMESERSTPELSYAVRFYGAHAGVMITASHNPPHDNGYKAYFRDGGQIVEPHASAIIAEVEATESATPPKSSSPGSIQTVGAELDQAYLEQLKTLVLEPETIRSQSSSLQLVFTPLHGTGIKIIPQMLEMFGFRVLVEKEQAVADGRFPTVKSPNPEYPEALEKAIALAQAEGADLVMATDPDADRMGVAVRAADGSFQLLTGNMIGSILAAYRLEAMKRLGWITPGNVSRATIIKTFVTTDLQKAIAHANGAKCVETLTGFKYIGEKLRIYEEQAGGRGGKSFDTWRETLLEKSSFFVFGGEESYGYSGGDYVRDKDANAAVLMVAEAAAWCKSRGMTLLDYMDDLYLAHGCYLEKLGTLTFEGAEGAAKIKRLLESYKTDPPRELLGKKVERADNFQEQEFKDVDGKVIPRELMLMFHLAGGSRIAVRGSGTEPKIKYYFFGREEARSREELPQVKAALKASLEELWNATQEDVNRRVG